MIIHFKPAGGSRSGSVSAADRREVIRQPWPPWYHLIRRDGGAGAGGDGGAKTARFSKRAKKEKKQKKKDISNIKTAIKIFLRLTY